MSKTVTTNVTVAVAGDGFVGPTYSNSSQNTAGIAPGSFTLAVGFNSIAVPAAAVGVTIVPPAASTFAKTLKGVTGDTGILLSPTLPTVLAFTAGTVAAIGITSTGIEILTLIWG